LFFFFVFFFKVPLNESGGKQQHYYPLKIGFWTCSTDDTNNLKTITMAGWVEGRQWLCGATSLGTDYCNSSLTGWDFALGSWYWTCKDTPYPLHYISSKIVLLLMCTWPINDQDQKLVTIYVGLTIGWIQKESTFCVQK